MNTSHTLVLPPVQPLSHEITLPRRFLRGFGLLGGVGLLTITSLLLLTTLARMKESDRQLRDEADASRTVAYGLRMAAIRNLPQFQALQAKVLALGGKIDLVPRPSDDYKGEALVFEDAANVKAIGEEYTLRCNRFTIRVSLPQLAHQTLEVAYHIDGGGVFVQPAEASTEFVVAAAVSDWTDRFRFTPADTASK